MKRDWYLIRTILLKIEDKASCGDPVRPEAVSGYNIEDVSCHIHLLGQAGIITAQRIESTRRRNA